MQEGQLALVLYALGHGVQAVSYTHLDVYKRQIENLAATTLRNISGDLELDTTLVSRDTINAKMRSILDEATDAWGIKVNRVEVKNITPPAAIQQAMEKQMKAEREKREAILLAEGEKQSAITVAEGNKQAQILAAEDVYKRQPHDVGVVEGARVPPSRLPVGADGGLDLGVERAVGDARAFHRRPLRRSAAAAARVVFVGDIVAHGGASRRLNRAANECFT